MLLLLLLLLLLGTHGTNAPACMASTSMAATTSKTRCETRPTMIYGGTEGKSKDVSE